MSIVAASASVADVQAGKSAAQSKCSQCHDADDWEGEDAASLESLIRDIVAGKVKHKGKLELSPAEIADIAAYWGRPGK
jgi:mono/diheme cytochrome c family protein